MQGRGIPETIKMIKSVLTYSELDKLKFKIENEYEAKPQYWVKFGYKCKVPPSAEHGRLDVVRWATEEAKKCDTHIKPWGCVEIDPDIRFHMHSIISGIAALPITIFDSWLKKHGDIWIGLYDSEKFATHYQWIKHQYEEIQIICPRKKSSCRRKMCKYQLYNL